MSQQNKQQHWINILEQQQQSGVSIKQFCAEQNINYQTFYYWSKKLSKPEPKTQVQPIVVTEPTTHSNSVVLTFSNGIRAELPIALNLKQIKNWVEALQ